jgi:hypothetical protein
MPFYEYAPSILRGQQVESNWKKFPLAAAAGSVLPQTE